MANLRRGRIRIEAANREAAHGREKSGDDQVDQDKVGHHKVRKNEISGAARRPEKISAAQDERRLRVACEGQIAKARAERVACKAGAREAAVRRQPSSRRRVQGRWRARKDQFSRRAINERG